jgi:Arc/MetJ-type ribon-helix-helix transcriptional regulator
MVDPLADAPRKASNRRNATSGSGYTRITVTIPTEVAQAVRRRVESGASHTMSALVTDALVEKLEQHDLSNLLDEMVTDFGTVPIEVKAWADKAIGRVPAERVG